MRASSLLTLSLCAGIATVAQAQTAKVGDSATISVYGIFDVGVGNEAHSQNWSPSVSSSTNPFVQQSGDKSVTGLYTGGLSCSRLGIKASYKLSEDWSAIFVAEAALDATSGQLSNFAQGMTQASTGSYATADSSLSGQLFARAFYGGVTSDTYGTLTFGRNPSLILDMAPSIDPMSASQLFSPIGFSGTYGGGGGSTDNSRMDNSIKYKVKGAGLNLGLLYKFGNIAGSSKAGSGYGINLGYEVAGLDVQVAYQKLFDAGLLYNSDLTQALWGVPGPVVPSLGTTVGTNGGFDQLTVLWADTTASLLSVKYKTGDFTFRVGGQHIEIADPSNPVLDGRTTNYLGQPVGLNLTGLFGFLDSSGLTANEKTLSLWWVGAAVDVTPQFNVALGYYSVQQNNFSGATTLAAGTDHFSGSATYTSLILDYHITKKFDVYLGVMLDTVKNGMDYAPYTTVMGSNQMLHDTNSMTGLGMRYSF
jgi:general bacterial porin, GBP family